LVAWLDERQEELAIVPGGLGGLGGTSDIFRGHASQVRFVVEENSGSLHRLLDPLAEFGALT
jgi:hypothetical protein